MGRGIGMAQVVIDVASKKFLGPDGFVLFLGMNTISDTAKKLVALPKQSIPAEPIKLTKTCTAEVIIKEAAAQRFSQPDLDVAEANIYISAGKKLAPQHLAKEGLQQTLTLEESMAEQAPTVGLWLQVEMRIGPLASARARAADAQLAELKMEAQMSGITFSDTQFAALLGRVCCVLTRKGVQAAVAGLELP